MVATSESSTMGLKQGHSYTVLSSVEVKSEDGKVARLIKLRSSYSEDKYTGPWSVQDKAWTPEMKSFANFTDGEENTFFMTV